MGFLSAYTGTIRVKVGPPDQDYWVDLKKYITQGGQEEAEKALLRMKIVGNDTVPNPDVARWRKLLVTAALSDWNLTDDKGQVLPLNAASVNRLPIPVFNQLWLQVQANNSETEKTPEEQIDFRQ